MQRYEKYKDSGIDRLGEIPEHWEVKRFQSLFLLGKGLSITKADLKEEGVRCVNYGEIHSKYGFELKPEKHSLKFVDKSYLKTYPNALLKKGDFVFADTSEDISGSGNFTFLNSDISVFSGYHTVIARPIHKGESKFFAYQFDSTGIRQQIRCKVKGVKVFSITQSLLKEVQLFIPQLHEQKAISKFLDDKCEKIDSAIHLKEQQIEKLKEFRQITIHNAVTKGVRHFKGEIVPTKYSGIDWIGEIPKYWEVKRLKTYTELVNGYAFNSDEFVSEGIQLLRISNLYNNKLSLDRQPTFISKDSLSKYKDWVVSRGDILISLTGTLGKRDYGYAIIIEKDDMFFLNQRVAKITHHSIDKKYLLFILHSELFLAPLFSLPSGTKQANLSNDNILNIFITVPSIREQQEIVAYLEEQTSKIDKAIVQRQEQIVKLKEYKQSLINEAVTGKIKIIA